MSRTTTGETLGDVFRAMTVSTLTLLVGCSSSSRNSESVEALVRSEVAKSFITEGQYDDGETYIRGVTLGDKEADTLLSRLDELPSLEELRLSGASLNDQQLTALEKLTFLRQLNLGSCQLTDDRMRFLNGFTNLTKLSIAHCPVTDRGLGSLSEMSNLEQLELINTKVQGAGFSELEHLPKLRFLALTGSPIGDDGVEGVKHLSKLETLYLIDTAVTRDGLMKLVDLHWLNSIGLPNKIVGPDNDERIKQENLNQLYRDFCDASIASRQRARANGENVPTSDDCPFTPALNELDRNR